mmetsp:Transcript_5256/g.15225  ORF Transcript_5256/g.15225 Transcript_5256/m.15225 type:complete len:127 (+) Transcript_5256:378-758(+)
MLFVWSALVRNGAFIFDSLHSSLACRASRVHDGTLAYFRPIDGSSAPPFGPTLDHLCVTRLCCAHSFQRVIRAKKRERGYDERREFFPACSCLRVRRVRSFLLVCVEAHSAARATIFSKAPSASAL